MIAAESAVCRAVSCSSPSDFFAESEGYGTVRLTGKPGCRPGRREYGTMMLLKIVSRKMACNSIAVLATGVALSGMLSACCHAQQSDPHSSSLIDTVAEGDWDYEQTYPQRPEPRDIIHQKAQMRWLARASRINAMHWYGMSNQRPTANATPFTSMYSPTWQMPGGRPYAWYHRGTSSTVVLHR